jgi:multidrug efflux pump subunit AcrB
MLSLILTVVGCVIFPIFLILLAAVWGTRQRLNLANKILDGIKRDNFKELEEPSRAKKNRTLALVNVVCLALVLLIMGLVISKVLEPTAILLIIPFAMTGSVIGIYLYREVTKRVK